MSKEIKELHDAILRVTKSVVVHTPNYSKFGGYDGENDIYTMDIAKVLYHQEGYRKQSEWISVDERLPDCEYGSETEALLFRLKTGSVEAGYFGTGGRFRDKYFRCYHHANEGWDAKDVTHWMPLPEPPKMKGGAE